MKVIWILSQSKLGDSFNWNFFERILPVQNHDQRMYLKFSILNNLFVLSFLQSAKVPNQLISHTLILQIKEVLIVFFSSE